MQASGIPQSTVKLRNYHLRRFANDSGRAPFDVGLDHLVHHLAGHEWSPNYRRSVRTTLRAFYAWSVTTDRMNSNPALALPKVPAPIGKPRPAPEEAVQAGLATLNKRDRLMILLGAHAGLRCREIAVVHTRRDLVRDLVGWSLIVHGKGDKERVVPINDDLARELRLMPAGYAFPGRIDGHLSPAHVSKLLSRALSVGVTGHRLRHRFASKAYAADRDIRAVQELLGHASVATTQIYTAIPDDALRRAVYAAAS